VACDIFQSGYDIAGGGTFGSKDKPRTKEQADYNLKYLIAAALLDGQVGPAQLEPQRIQAADAQALLARIDVRPDEAFSARYPQELNARVTIRMKDERQFVQEKLALRAALRTRCPGSALWKNFTGSARPMLTPSCASGLSRRFKNSTAGLSPT